MSVLPSVSVIFYLVQHLHCIDFQASVVSFDLVFVSHDLSTFEETEAVLITVKDLVLYPYLQARQPTCHHFTDADRRNKIPRSEAKDFITHSI
jgi:hypothetical protein